MTITISKIAKEAGVSTSAVSKALNGKKDISPATSEHIKAIALRMGYSANFAAKALVSKKTMTVGIVIPFPELTTGMERIQGIQDRCDQEGYLTTCAFHNGNPDDESRRLNYLKGRVDGIIITPLGGNGKLRDIIRDLAVPVVFMSEAVQGINIDFVSDDDEEGGYLAASHLLQEGHKSFAYSGNSSNIHSDQCVMRGIRRACEENKCNFDDIMVSWGNASKEKAITNIKLMLHERPDISGVFCFSDMAALWAMEELLTRGKNIPEDFAIVGYDDIKFASMAKIPLTSVSQPSLEIGTHAASLVLERIKEKKKSKTPKKIIFNPKLIVRQSSSRNK
jgi:LacI family transcriptional regulator, galactose operon repressor